MHADPLFVDLRIALANAEPIRMAHEFPGRRPAVLSAQSLDHLNQLRGFRHVARNTYAHQLDHDRLINNAQFAIRLLPLLATDVDSLERYMMSDDSSAPH